MNIPSEEMTSDGTARREKKRSWKYLLIGVVPVVLIIAVLSFRSWGEPRYQGKGLREWMKGHPRDYVPAVRAMGANAIPFLLSEVQSKDSALSKVAQEVLRQCLDSGAPWETARTRHYHARLALQILDTNAVPALLKALFREPFEVKESHLTWEAANAFNWLRSAEAREQVRQALSKALQDPEARKRRNACLAFYAGFRGSDSESHKLVELTQDAEPLVRAAATRALIIWQTNEVEVIPALAARLDDSQAAIRRLAIEALTARKTNAIAALPALLAAYTNELTRTSLRDDVDDVFRGKSVLSPRENQSGIFYAIQVIAPGTAVPKP